MKRFLATFVLLLLILTGCTSKSTSEDTQQTNQSTNQPPETQVQENLLPTLRIGVMSDAGAAPFIIAKEKGFFKAHNLPVEIQVFRSALDRDSALQTGNLDGAMADMLTIAFYKASGLNAKMIADTYGNYILVTSPKLDANTFAALTEKSIGVSSNTVIEFSTDKIAEFGSFTAQLDKVAIPQMPVRLEMLKSGELDGATLPEPLASAAVLEGGVRVGSSSDYGLYPGIFVMSDTALDNKAEIEALISAYNEAVDYLNSTGQSEFFNLLVDQLGFPPALSETFEMPKYTHASAPDEKTFEVTYQWMTEHNLIKTPFDYQDVTDTTFINN